MEANIGIRKMLLEDASAVSFIESAVATAPWSERLFFDCVSVGYECWVLIDEQKIVGYGILSMSIYEAHILNIAVEPHYQGHGLGKKMLQHVINIARAHGAREVFLEVRETNTLARNLYEKFNFVEIGIRKGYYPAENNLPAEDAVTYTLPLG